MTVTLLQPTSREAERLYVQREELVERIGRAIRADGTIQPLPGLHLTRVSMPFTIHRVLKPSVCVIAQGSKEVLLGDSRYWYDPAHFLLATLELPRVSQVLEASPEQPYLSLRLELTSTLVSAVLAEAGYAAPRAHAEVRAMAVSPVDGRLLDAVVRLVRLVETPADAQVLQPLYTREIIYRLLMIPRRVIPL